uniref:Uncharacterized protein n=1 Tax=Anguilla anguilla TaxID=7936 RepID=A0A0E9R503_ANGAN
MGTRAVTEIVLLPENGVLLGHRIIYHLRFFCSPGAYVYMGYRPGAL